MPARSETTKNRVTAAVDAAWRDFRRAVEQLPPHLLETPGVCGDWSVRDLLGHIASWESRAAAALLTGVPDPPDDIDEFNRTEAARKAPLAIRNVVAELESTHRALLSALTDAPEYLFEPGTPLRDSLDADTLLHYIEHTAQIRAWALARRHAHPDTRSGS